MRALLDINFLIALLDADHLFHGRAHDWWAEHAEQGWASCPLTENGVVRIMSNPAYSRSLKIAPADVVLRLGAFATNADHEFWPDEISLRDASVFALERIHSSRQLTDIYLLGLATHRKGRLVTFDRGVPLSAVPATDSANLILL